jgi:hypothetical protein
VRYAAPVAGAPMTTAIAHERSLAKRMERLTDGLENLGPREMRGAATVARTIGNVQK